MWLCLCACECVWVSWWKLEGVGIFFFVGGGFSVKVNVTVKISFLRQEATFATWTLPVALARQRTNPWLALADWAMSIAVKMEGLKWKLRAHSAELHFYCYSAIVNFHFFLQSQPAVQHTSACPLPDQSFNWSRFLLMSIADWALLGESVRGLSCN